MSTDRPSARWRPERWQVVRLDSIADLVSGGTPSKSRPDWWSGSIPWASPKDMKHFRLRDTQDHISEEGLESGSRLVPAKSIFVVIRGMILAKDLPVAMAEVPMAFNQDMKAVVPRAGVDADYLLYAIAARKDALATAIGTSAHGTRRLGTSSLESLLLPLPPPDEQRAIARALSDVQAAVEMREKIVAALRDLKASTMTKLFREGLRAEKAERQDTRFGEVPAAWDTVPLGQVAHIQTGVAKGRKLRGESSIVEVPYLRVANVQDGFLDLVEIKTIELLRSEVARYSLKGGDVLLTEGGDFDKLGRGYVWGGQIAGCVHQNHIFAVRTDRARLLPDFFAYLAQSHYGKAYFLTVAHKTTNLASINSSKLKAFPVLLPTLEEQTGIAAALRRIDDALGVQMGRLDGLKSLFAAMLRLLMSGQVRVSHGIHGNACALGDVREDREMLGEKQQAKDVERVVAELVRRFDPERVILFGSSEEGVGLLVVMAFEGRALAQAVHIERELKPGLSLDLIVRRPEDVSRALAIGDAFIKGVVERGRTLYVRPGVEVSDSTAVTPRADARRVAPRRAMSEETLREIVRRIVDAVAPEKIILFGSAARGEMGPDSDVDLLVVKSGVDRQETARRVRHSLLGIGVAKDVIVATPDDLARCEHDRDSVISSALSGGQVVFDA